MKFVEGLKIARETLGGKTRGLLSGSRTMVPPRIENRSKFLPTSDQGSTPHCAAYAMAGVLEYWRWKLYSVYEQVDPGPIYSGAKARDGAPEEAGTTLEAVIESAVELGYISAPELVVLDDWRDVKRALHRYDVMLAGFLINDGWYDARPDGWIPEGSEPLGGHAGALSDYADDYERYYGGQNSWGDSEWGWRGFFRMTPEQFKGQFVYGVCLAPGCIRNPAEHSKREPI